MSALSEARRKVAPGGKWVQPVPAPISTAYGIRGSMWSSGYHTGADFACPTGTPIRAVAAGRIGSVGDAGAYGNRVTIVHAPGFETWYAHMSRTAASPGQMVAAGAVIGYVGETGNTTGPHLHLEVRVNGVTRDPAPYLSGAADAPSSPTYPTGAQPTGQTTNPAIVRSGNSAEVGDLAAEARRAVIVLTAALVGVVIVAVGVAQGTQPRKAS